MLTKSDLRQIQKVVKREIKSEVDPLKKDIKTVKSDVSTLKKDVTKIRKDVNVIVSLFDREYLELRARGDRIERHLDIAPLPGLVT